ncbi:hypothetical protein ABBQ32_001455 [Trebouxia sp. C0010 RCD-2024]
MGLFGNEERPQKLEREHDKEKAKQLAPAALATHLAFAVGGFLLSKVVKKIGGRKVGGGKRHPGAYVFVIRFKFASVDDRDAWFKKFKILAEYVADNEPTTLAYEAAVAEDDPLEVLAYERYVDKDALHEIHERSTPYLRLKDDVKSEGIEYKSVVSQSYYEQDLGFMETKF